MTGDRSPHTTLGAGREFDAIRALLVRWGSLAAGIGDDCAVLDVPAGERLCVSTDSSVEGVHFRREWLTPAEIGYRATMAALSDLAAMAARPLGLLVALAAPTAWRTSLDGIADGIGAAARDGGAPVLGGDTTGGERLALTITVLGAAAEPVTRGGGRAGDALFVTGRLGGPRLALDALEAGRVPDRAHRDRFARPRARLLEARWLAGRGASALIDVSDGLLGDAAHLAAASAARVTIDLQRVPCVAGARPLDAAASGEEYELLCAAPATIDAAEFERAFGVPLTGVGWLAAGPPGVDAMDGPTRVDLPRGYDHFSTA